MIKLKIKPLSVNQCWQGKRFKTKTYRLYEKEILLNLKKIKVPEGNLQINLIFGLSSKNADWDNPIKPFQDILQKKYDFNDSRIYKAIVEKVIVKEGEEFIKFELKSYEEH